MKNIKFVVKVHRRDARGLQYVQRVDPTPIQMTTNRKLALKIHCGRPRSILAKLALHTGVGVGAGHCLVFALRTVRERQPSSDHIQRSKPQ